MAGHGAAVLLPRDEAGVRENVEMLHHGWERHRIGARKVADGCAAARLELRKQRATRGVRKRSKGTVEDLIFILNH